jgi:hypothetical protein
VIDFLALLRGITAPESLPERAAVLTLTLLFVALTIAAALDYAWAVAILLGGVAVLLIIHQLQQCAAATAATLGTLQELREQHNVRDGQEVRSDLDSP